MTNKQLLFGTTVIGLSLAIAGTGLASAHGGRLSARPHHVPPREVQVAIGNSDYAAWVKALEGHERVPFAVNEETFEAFQKAHDLVQSGDRESARQVLEEAGITLPAYGKAHGHRFLNNGRNDIRDAIESNDYVAWQEAVVGTKLETIATPEVFGKMVAIHDARTSGDRELAKSLHRELRELLRSHRAEI